MPEMSFLPMFQLFPVSYIIEIKRLLIFHFSNVVALFSHFGVCLRMNTCYLLFAISLPLSFRVQKTDCENKKKRYIGFIRSGILHS